MTVRVAAVQASPVLLDLEASLEKALRLVEEAASQGARFVAFGETWLPGYPVWLDVAPGAALWDSPEAKAVFARLRQNAVVVPGPVTDALASAARKHGVVIDMSVHERVEGESGHGTLYNTMLTFDADGTLRRKHRKLVPTYTERLVWGPGDGGGLDAVETAVGRVGGLVCWEHWMPLARQAVHESGEQIHVAVWPRVHEMHLIASRHYAFEGRCFVLALGQILHRADVPDALALPPDTPDLLLDGGSAILGPDGALVAGPVYGEERILLADLDLARIDEESMTLDVTGHYSRPDLLRLDRTRP